MQKLRLYEAAANILRGEFLNQGPVLDCCFHDDSSGYSATASADNRVSRYLFRCSRIEKVEVIGRQM